MIRRLVCATVIGMLLVPLTATVASASPQPSIATAASADDPIVAGDAYPGDPVAEAALVAAEERRIIDIDAIDSQVSAADASNGQPYRVSQGALPTLVLTERDSAYTLSELTELAPRTVVQQDDGSFLISENILVTRGATLRITAPAGSEVRLASSPSGFVSIVTDGGSLSVRGSDAARLPVTSWDPVAERPDLLTDDGRAYLRVSGGVADLQNATFSDLGFWSGLTGGVAFTGTVLPDGLGATSGEPVDAPAGTDGDLLDELLPADGGVATLDLEPGLTDSFASGVVHDVTFSRNAFGLFVTNSDRVEIYASVIEDSLVDGLVFHRDVTNSRVESTESRGNAQDGFDLARATTGIVLSGLTAVDNGRNGITIEGRPLVDGPSATGIGTGSYGDNQVTDSTSTGNGRYGIEVVGGDGITIDDNTVSDNQMGIVVTFGATGVVIRDNRVLQSARQGIALRDSAVDAVVEQNEVRGAPIGIFASDAGGSFQRNIISEVTNHGITLVGETGASIVVENRISGSGPSAVDVTRTTGAAVRANEVSGWESTKPLDVVLRSVFQPLTVLWLLIGLILLVSLGARRRARGIRDPFADHAPLGTYSRGVFDIDDLRSRPDRGAERAERGREAA
ncbi:MAG: right-handed parallel beta-helix repeat-containing protein [Pseudolysinimonas sp.]